MITPDNGKRKHSASEFSSHRESLLNSLLSMHESPLIFEISKRCVNVAARASSAATFTHLSFYAGKVHK
ncbi:MAG TPA: hypothetical protein VGM01_11640, partial [Ktedonobacteraceae bacterium]